MITKRAGRFATLICAAIALCASLASCATGPSDESPSPTSASPPVRGNTALGAGASPTATLVGVVSVATAPLPTAPDSAAPTAALTEYTVQPGDTLLALASEWGVSMAAIQKANHLAGSTDLQAGVQLLVPSPDEWQGASTYWLLHAVQPGETLGQIAQRHGLSLARLLEVNDVADADLIVVGQELVLPLNALVAYVEAPSPEPTEPPTPEPSATATPEPTTLVTATATVEFTPVVETPVVPDTPTVPAPSPAPPPPDIAQWPYELVRIINATRAQHGLPAYVYNETLAKAAQAHANDCVARGWCSHTGSDGSSVRDRILRSGYGGTGWAECWAQRQTPQGTFDIWWNEVPPDDAHRRMILHTWFVDIGVGIAKAPWGYYFIADFGRP